MKQTLEVWPFSDEMFFAKPDDVLRFCGCSHWMPPSLLACFLLLLRLLLAVANRSGEVLDHKV